MLSFFIALPSLALTPKEKTNRILLRLGAGLNEINYYDSIIDELSIDSYLEFLNNSADEAWEPRADRPVDPNLESAKSYLLTNLLKTARDLSASEARPTINEMNLLSSLVNVVNKQRRLSADGDLAALEESIKSKLSSRLGDLIRNRPDLLATIQNPLLTLRIPREPLGPRPIPEAWDQLYQEASEGSAIAERVLARYLETWSSDPGNYSLQILDAITGQRYFCGSGQQSALIAKDFIIDVYTNLSLYPQETQRQLIRAADRLIPEHRIIARNIDLRRMEMFDFQDREYFRSQVIQALQTPQTRSQVEPESFLFLIKNYPTDAEANALTYFEFVLLPELQNSTQTSELTETVSKITEFLLDPTHPDLRQQFLSLCMNARVNKNQLLPLLSKVTTHLEPTHPLKKQFEFYRDSTPSSLAAYLKVFFRSGPALVATLNSDSELLSQLQTYDYAKMTAADRNWSLQIIISSIDAAFEQIHEPTFAVALAKIYNRAVIEQLGSTSNFSSEATKNILTDQLEFLNAIVEKFPSPSTYRELSSMQARFSEWIKVRQREFVGSPSSTQRLAQYRKIIAIADLFKTFNPSNINSRYSPLSEECNVLYNMQVRGRQQNVLEYMN